MGYFADNIVLALEAVLVNEARDDDEQSNRSKNMYIKGDHYKYGAAHSKALKKVEKHLSEKERNDLWNGARKNAFSTSLEDQRNEDEKKADMKANHAIDATMRHERRHGNKSLKEAFDDLYEED